jgi:AcrR family transcriptional regulator
LQQKPSQNPPGRPRAFDEADALDAAMRVFAAKGYEAASLTALECAMGINRVSIYATFGNKEALFVRAMDRYITLGNQRFGQCLAARTARQAFERVLREAVAMFTDPQGQGVCFVTQAPLTSADISAETKQFVAEKRAGIESMLRCRLTQAMKEDELPPDMAVEDTARFYAVTILGLALYAQHGGAESELMRVVDFAMSRWPQLDRNPMADAPATQAETAALQ